MNPMGLHAWLMTAFEYDAWANRRWAENLGRFKDGHRATEIYQHIIRAQNSWITRCGVTVEYDKQDEHLAAVAESSAQAWRMFLDVADLDEVVRYTTTTGDTFQNTIGEIALHVINHGTYHRGHLRGLAEAEGIHDFKDTDLIFYLRERSGKSVS